MRESGCDVGNGDDAERSAVLKRLGILDTAPEPAFEAQVKAAQAMFGVATVLVSFVDIERQWFKARVGLCASETSRGVSFCQHALAAPHQVLVVPDARADARFADNALVTGDPFIRFYAGAPLVLEGTPVGALCLIDPEPRHDFGAEQQALLTAMAAPIEELLRLRLESLERAEMARALDFQSAKLSLAEQMAGVGHWSLEAESGRVTWSDEVYRIHGVTRANFDPQYDDAVAFYEPEWRERVERYVERAVTHGVGFAFKGRLRRRSDGAVRTVSTRAEFRPADGARPAELFGVFQDVTEQDTLLQTIDDERARYRLLADNANDMMSTSTLDSTLLFVTPAVERLLGYTADEVLGRKTMELTHPDDLPQVQALFESLVKMGRHAPVSPYQFRGLHKNGSWVWLEGQPRVQFNAEGKPACFQDVVRDIDARRRAEDAAREAAAQAEAARDAAAASESRYRMLADNSTDLILRLGLDGRILYASPAALPILGYGPEEGVGQTLLSFAHPEDFERAAAITARTLAGEAPDPAVDRAFRARRKDGDYVWIESAPSLVRDAEGRPVEVVSTLRDVTARRFLQAELERAKETAELAVEAKAAFLANMSHELRTPLTGILGYADVLRGSATLEPDQRRYAELIGQAGRSLLALVNDVLDLSKIEAGAADLSLQDTDLADLLRRAVDLVRPLADAKGLALEVALPQGPVAVRVDPDRLRQVVLNLVGNAVKFTEAGAVRLTLEARPGRGRRAALRIAVADTGIGIPADQIAQVFGRFEQADASITRRFGGTGLGLAISRALVLRMGGTLEVESEPGQGSTFTLTLEAPIARPAARPARRTAKDDDLAGLRVLLAEDVEMNRELVGLFLGRHGVDLTGVANGEEAVRAAADADFDLILMDMQMPVMDGLEATRRIRADGGAAARVPILALTANVLPDEIAKCRAAGMTGHVAKPFTAEILADALRASLRGEARI